MKHIIKYLILALLLVNITVCVSAQTVGYWHKILSPEGCTVQYSVVKHESGYYIVATVHSERMHFGSESDMKVRTFNDEVLTLKGEVVSSGSQTSGIISGTVVIPVTELITTARYAITPEEFEILNHGVAKVRLSMVPVNHERTFKKDKIGKELYQFYLKAKAKDDDF